MEANIGFRQTLIHLDSGADVSVVPPELVHKQEYTRGLSVLVDWFAYLWPEAC